MKILALDTSQLQACVCVLDDGKILSSEMGSTSVAHSESVLPMVDSALKKAGISLKEIEIFACGVGPGSFTGLRIGCATTKAFAQSLGTKVLAFSSLKALVFSGAQDSLNKIALVNAYQGQAFIGYSEAKQPWKEEAEVPALWCQQHQDFLKGGAVFIGTGVRPFQKSIEEATGLSLKAETVEYVSAEGIQKAVSEVLASPVPFLSHDQLAAHYMRPSQAEVKWQQTHGNS